MLTAEIIFGIESESFCEFSDAWSFEMVKAHLNSKNSVTLIKTINGVPAGYVTGVKLENESELYRIAVLPKYRGQGLAKELIARFIETCDNKVFLEVRAKNTAAIRLYESAGFAETGRRINYYGDDDAVVYSL
ncbi:MAG: ribosomal protein S18-alanine N-acetyltransferase [Oscillospiraceae bacterium]|nr:ribosomal protein S18-alanine N-acetyltransferase [Oscillospiraceae bacterium]